MQDHGSNSGTEFPLVDPRGLVTPYYDGWSIDVWIIPEEGEPLIPSRSPSVSQKLGLEDNICVTTESSLGHLKLQMKARVIGSAVSPICQVKVTGDSSAKARLVVSLRPYNPEGVSFINVITLLKDSPGWQVNKENFVYFDKAPEQYLFSDYERGDVFSRLASKENEKEILCKVGMASSAAVFVLEAGRSQEIIVSVPLSKNKVEKVTYLDDQETAQLAWKNR